MRKTVLSLVLTVMCFIISYIAAQATERKPGENVGENVVRRYSEAMPKAKTVSLMNQAIAKSIEDIEIEAGSNDVSFFGAKEDAYVQFNGVVGGDLPKIDIDERKMSIMLPKQSSLNWSFQMGPLTADSDDLGRGLKVYIPDSVKRIVVKSSSGDAKFENVSLQTLNINASSGDVAISGAKILEANVTTSSGDIQLEADLKKLNLVSSSGDQRIDIKGCEDMSSVASSGDIYIESSCVNMRAVSSSGDITLRDRNTAPQVSLLTSSGDVKVVLLSKDVGLKMNFNSRSGDIHADSLKELVKHAEDEKHFVLGNGDGNVEVNTSSGDLRISLE